jgi:SAM-dependent methyltransferase
MTADQENAAEFYDQMWKSYGHLDGASPAAFHRRRLVVALAKRANPNARRVLDAGCGQGELLAELAHAFPSAEVSGADVSEQSLADTRKKRPGAELFLLDLAAPDFSERQRERAGRFDVVVCSEVIEHIPAAARAAESLRELLAPGGVAVVTVPGGKMSRFDQLIGHQRHYSPRALRHLLERAGYDVDLAMGWGFPFHNLYRTAVRIASRAALPKTTTDAPERGGLTTVLSGAYSLFGRSLKPLFYLNLSRWGEQTIVVARRPPR